MSDTTSKFYVEPIGFGDGIYGPFDDEAAATDYISESEVLAAHTHKVVPHPADEEVSTLGR